MKCIDHCAPVARELFNCLADELELGQPSLKELEEKILQFVRRLGALMLAKVVERIGETTQENTTSMLTQGACVVRKPCQTAIGRIQGLAV